jgi:hypothetical protein
LNRFGARALGLGFLHGLTNTLCLFPIWRRFPASEVCSGSRSLPASRTDAPEVSLAENVSRIPMHPANQYEAFKAMADAGSGSSN